MPRVNLIPETVRVARARRRHVRRWAAGIVLATGGVVTLAGTEWLDRAKAADLRAQNDRLQVELEAARAELRSVAAEGDRARLQIERAKTLESKRAWSGMLAMIASCMSPGSWLTSIATDPQKPPEGGTRSNAGNEKKADQTQQTVMIEAPRKLRINGYASEAAHPHEVVKKLKNTGVFRRVALERSQREPVLDGSYFRFELVCEW